MLTISNEFQMNVRRFIKKMDHYRLRDEFKIFDEILSLEHVENSIIIDELDLIQQELYLELADRFMEEDFMCRISPGHECYLKKSNECNMLQVK